MLIYNSVYILYMLFTIYKTHAIFLNRICILIVSMLASSAMDREFEPRLGKTKDYEIDILKARLGGDGGGQN